MVTCGAIQSNHCRLTLAASAKEGLQCRLVLEERVPNSYDPEANGNNFLFHLMDVAKVKVVPGQSNMLHKMETVAEDALAEGKTPYIIPGGGSNSLGALGYVACAQEINAQLFSLGLQIDRVVCASGSAGTHTGLLAGLHACSSKIQMTGINVSRTKNAQEEIVSNLAAEVADLLQLNTKIQQEAVLCFDYYVGKGYSIPTAGMVEAVKMLAKHEAVLLNPVYTCKAMAGLIDHVRKDLFQTSENVLFLHTGGSPALFAYTDSFWK